LHRQRLVPLLEEQAAIEQLSYDYVAAKATLQRLLALDPDQVWSWIELGRLHETTGSLVEALTAFEAALAAARRTRDERDESAALNDIGDVLVEQGNLPEALKSFRDGLAIRDRLAQADPGNAGWQRDLSVSHAKLAAVFRREGETAKALEVLRRARATMVHMTTLSPDNAIWKNDLAWFDRQIADLAP
jgi:tetratricopeptide (TPR) repeat protein